MSLDIGLWSDLTPLVSSGFTIAVVALTAGAIRRRADGGLTARNSLVVPAVVGLAQMLFGGIVGPSEFYWYFVGAAVAAGAGLSMGVSLRRGAVRHSVVSLALIDAGIVLATLGSSVELRWVLLLVGLLGGVAFAVGYRLASAPVERWQPTETVA